MEASADVVRLAVLFTAGDSDVGGDVLAIDENPGHRAAGSTFIILSGAHVRVMQPILQSPNMGLFLKTMPTYINSANIAHKTTSSGYSVRARLATNSTSSGFLGEPSYPINY